MGSSAVRKAPSGGGADHGEAVCTVGGGRGYWGISVPSLQFCYKPKTTLKKIVIRKSWGQSRRAPVRAEEFGVLRGTRERCGASSKLWAVLPREERQQ